MSPLNEKYPNMADRIDIGWNRIGEIISADGTYIFKRLFPVAKLILSIPHSDTEEELLLSGIKLLFVQILTLKKPWENF